MGEQETTYGTVGFQNLLGMIYGTGGHSVDASLISLRNLKRILVKLLGTLSVAAERNITGDEAHKAQIALRFRAAIQSISIAKSKDEVNQRALAACIEANFLLLGQLPNNGRKRRTNWRGTVELGDYRTLFYVRTDTQRVAEMIHHEYKKLRGDDYESSCFARLIRQRQKHPKDDHTVLKWIRQNEPALFDRFNKA